MSNSTELVAWWGAIIATIVLIWDIVKWLRNAAILRFVVRPNAYYSDSEIIPVENSADGATGLVKEYIHIELTNIGTLPTTVMYIAARRQWRGGEVGNDGSAFKEHYGKTLPYVLRPGEVWSCRADQKKLKGLHGDRPLEIVIGVSRQAKPLIRQVNFLEPKKPV